MDTWIDFSRDYWLVDIAYVLHCRINAIINKRNQYSSYKTQVTVCLFLYSFKCTPSRIMVQR